ncbi:MAG: restriction endonuclease subunit S [Stenotrophomonas indicatrix]|uniref:restriction endonuclease subunit S n=1 Tax=Stenotrophomonas indicatrix TaxID=2045451 RepID=UPI003D12FEBB
MNFPAYSAYKDSGVEWLGDVPEHWTLHKLKYIARFSGGGTPSRECLSYWNGDIPWVSPKDMKVEVIVGAEENITIEGLQNSATSLVSPGGVLLVVRSGILKHTIPVAINNVEVALNQDMKALRFNPKLALFNFFCRWVQGFNNELRHAWLKQGATVESVEQEYLADTVVPMPAIDEQRMIVDFLDQETVRIDALIDEQQRLIELLKEKRQAVISHAVTKGIDPAVPMKDSGVEWLGEVPAHWEVGSLTRFIGPVVDYRGRTPTKVDDGIFLVTARNVRNGRIDYEASEEYADPESAESLLARGRPEIGDLLFTMEAPLGQVALIDRTDIALAQRIVKFRGEPSVMRNHYLMFWFMSANCQARLETLATGSTALGIKSSKLGMIECLAPTLSEQDAIISYIQRESEKNDALIYEAENVIGLLQERRSALISAAVTGRIDVRSWQPPAGAPSHELAQEAV